MVHAERTTLPMGGRRAFTLVEILFSLLIIFMLMAMLIVGFRYAMKTTAKTLDTQAVASLKMGVEEFKQQFGFFPPLVKDTGEPPGTGTGDPLSGNPPSVPVVFSPSVPADLTFLRGGTGTTLPPVDLRFSVYSLAYYVIGALEKDADGVAGPGFTAPTRDGGFTKKGPTLGPYFDTGRNEKSIYAADAEGRVELRDTGGVAFRYYRWLPDRDGVPPNTQPSELNEFLNVPLIVGDPEVESRLRNAEYAIVAAGKDGLFGDEFLLTPSGPGPSSHPQWLDIDAMASRLGISGLTGTAQEDAVRAKAREDNVVEVGR